MITLYIITSILIICYSLLVLILIKAWNKTKEYQKGSLNPFDIYISVVIAARNEEKNIIPLLKSIRNQDLSIENFEVIIVDDFSTDKTYEKTKEFCNSAENFSIHKLTESFGKKNALKKAISLSKGKLIVTTDADCIVPKTWLSTIISFYEKNKPKMIIAPVFQFTTNYFSKIQALDFLSLVSSSAATCAINRPIMANGANLAYEKSTFLEFSNPLNDAISSGDDIFLMLNIKNKYPKGVKFLKSNEAVVITKPEKGFKNFISQRKRWASKSGNYKDKDIILSSFIVFISNLFLLSNILLMFVNLKFAVTFIAFFSLKLLLDFAFLYNTSSFFSQKKLLWYIFPTELFNILLIPHIAISGIFGKTIWKEREI